MIEQLYGRVVHRDGGGAILMCGGVGYGVSMPAPAVADLAGRSEEILVWVHTQVSQDRIRLFGFLSEAQKSLFRTLIGVSGVGPKMGLAVLSALDPEALRDIVDASDLAAMVRIPGVGKKTAERLLLELRDKLGPAGAEAVAMGGGSLKGDLISALENLGFKGSAAEKAAKQIMEDNPEERDLAVLVREALRASTKR